MDYLTFLSFVVIFPIALYAFFRVISNDSPKDYHQIPKLNVKNEAQNSWKKPLAKLAVQFDIVRLMEKTTVFDSGNLIWDVSLEKSTEEAPRLFSLLRTIIRKIENQDVQQKMEEECNKEINLLEPGKELSKHLFNLLQDIFREDSKTVKLLKACTQSIIASPVMNMKAAFSKEQIRFKDVRGSWSIQISFEKDTVRVSHTKKEQSHEETFDFQWKFSVEFDKEMSRLLKTEFSLENVNWGSANSETKATIRRLAKTTFDYASNI